MFERKFRLPKGHFKSERILSSQFYNLKLAKNGLPFSRFGIIISKKIDKRATVRNRIKRKLRSCIQENLNKVIGGYDFLFILKTIPEENSYCGVFLSQFKKAKFIIE